jgi:hypothetical protein
MNTEITARHPDLKPASTNLKADYLVENNGLPFSVQDSICGLLQYLSGNPNDPNGTTYYRCTGVGCVTIILTDCNGTFVSSMQYQCQPPNTLNVNGCHAFQCSC